MKKTINKIFVCLLVGLLSFASLFWVGCELAENSTEGENTASPSSAGGDTGTSETGSDFGNSSETPSENLSPETVQIDRMTFSLSEDKSYYTLTEFDYGKKEEVVTYPLPAIHVDIPAEVEGLPVKEIGAKSFIGLKKPYINLVGVTIPDSVESIGNSAFMFSTIRRLVIPEGVTTIGNWAFGFCECLVSLTLPSTLVSWEGEISSSWLREIYNFSSITVNAKSAYSGRTIAIYTSAEEESQLTFTEEGYIFCEKDGEYSLIGYEGMASNLILPREFNGKPYSIENKAFLYCRNLSSVVIPIEITSVGEGAFVEVGYWGSVMQDFNIYCEATEKPTNWAGSWHIAWEGVPSPAYYEEGEQIHWGDSWEYIDGMPVLKEGEHSPSENLPPETVQVDRMTFSLSRDESYYILISFDYLLNDISAESFVAVWVDIPSEIEGLPVKEIGEKAFYNDRDWIMPCVYMIGVTIPDSIEVIGDYAFYESKIRRLVIPEGVTTIGKEALGECPNLISLTLPKSLTSWDGKISTPSRAVYNSKLKEIYNFSSVTIDNERVESGDAVVYTRVEEKSQITVAEEGFIFFEEGGEYSLIGYEGTASNLILPREFNGKAYFISNEAFAHCSWLRTVVIPIEIASVGYAAFEDPFRYISTLEKIEVYCEATEKPDSWHNSWNCESSVSSAYYEDGKQVHWGDSWEYVGGMPVLKG